MKKTLLLLLLSWVTIASFAQTQPNLPTGSTLYGNQLYISPDGNVWTGTPAKNYRNLGAKSKVDSLLNLKVDKISGKGLSAEDYTTLEKNKLSGVASGATANQTDAYLLSRSNHTGIQPINTISGLQSSLDGKINIIDKAVPNGVATLDVNGNVPLSQINASLLGAVNYQGTYNAGSNSPVLGAASSANKGWYYIVSSPGNQSGLSLSINDWVISNGITWGKVDNNNSITSVAGKSGAVVLNKGDVGLGALDNTSDLSKPISTATQSALNGKLDVSGGTITGSLQVNSFVTTRGISIATNGLTQLGTSVVGNGSNPYASGGIQFYANSTNGGTNYYTTLSPDGTQTTNNNLFLPPLRIGDGVLAQRAEFSSGKTIGANTTGSANIATLWNGRAWTGSSAGNDIYFMTSPDAGNWGYATASQARTYLGMPVSGEDLTSITTRGSATPNTTFVTGQSNPSGLPTTRATYMQQIPSGSGLIESYNFSTSTGNNLAINPNGGNVGIGTLSPFSKFQILVKPDINFAIATGGTDANAVLIAGINSANTTLKPLEYRASYHNFAAGNVGIGTSAPLQKLVVSDNGGTGIEVAVNQDASGSNIIQSFNRSTSAYAPLIFRGTSVLLDAPAIASNSITSTFGEAFRNANNQGYMSWYNSTNTIRTGYFQMDATTGNATLQVEIGLKQLNLNPNGIVLVPAPTAPTSAVTKGYVDAKVLTASATLDFPSIKPGESYGLTVTVTGAVKGDPVVVGGLTINGIYAVSGYVSDNNVVTVACYNYTTGTPIDPVAAIYKVKVLKD